MDEEILLTIYSIKKKIRNYKGSAYHEIHTITIRFSRAIWCHIAESWADPGYCASSGGWILAMCEQEQLLASVIFP